MNKNELKQFLIEEELYSESEVCKMSSTELLDAWLRYEGIIGFTDNIVEVVSAAFGVDLLD